MSKGFTLAVQTSSLSSLKFSSELFKSKQTVLDPFCGSSTTVVEANEWAILSAGYDV